MQQQTVSNRSFYRTVATLVIPLALQNLISVGVQSADVIMLGRLGAIPLSAASLAGQVQFVMMLIFFGLASGASVLTAQYWGKGNIRAIEQVMSLVLRLAAVISVVFFLVAELFPAQLMRIFIPDEEVIRQGVLYLRLVAPSYLIVGLTNLYLNVMRSVERVVVSTVTYFISLIANVLFNAVLIFGLLGFPAMGIEGAALATTLARCVELVIVVVYAARNKTVRLRIKDFIGFNKALLKDFIKYALPTTLNEMLWGMAISANAVIIGHLGAQAVAANSVTQVMRQLATVVSFGVASATAILVGKAIGAGQPEKAQIYAAKLLRLAFFTGITGCGVILLLRPVILAIMNLPALANDYLWFQLFIMSFYVICQAVTATLVVGICRGGGDIRFGLFLDIGTMWGCSILLAVLAAFVFHAPVKVVLALIMVDEFIKLPACLWRYRGKSWLRNVTR